MLLEDTTTTTTTITNTTAVGGETITIVTITTNVKGSFEFEHSFPITIFVVGQPPFPF